MLLRCQARTRPAVRLFFCQSRAIDMELRTEVGAMPRLHATPRQLPYPPGLRLAAYVDSQVARCFFAECVSRKHRNFPVKQNSARQFCAVNACLPESGRVLVSWRQFSQPLLLHRRSYGEAGKRAALCCVVADGD